MLDSRMRALLGPALEAASRRLAGAGVPPAALTGAGWAAGAGACAVPDRNREGFPDRAPAPATLAANEALARRREAGATVLPLAFARPGCPSTPPCGRRLPQPPAATPTLPWPACPNCTRQPGTGRGASCRPPLRRW